MLGCAHRFFPIFLVFTNVVVLPQTPPATPADQTGSLEKYRTAESYIREKLSIWQKRLKLQDWNLSARMVHTPELKPKTLGNIHWDAETKTATIKVLDIADYKLSFADALKDIENTIVHELVHLNLASLPRNEASRSAEERAVNSLTEALLNLDRRELTAPAATSEPSSAASR